MYSLGGAEIFLIISTALNIKPTWASHITSKVQEKARPSTQHPTSSPPAVLVALAPTGSDGWPALGIDR